MMTLQYFQEHRRGVVTAVILILVGLLIFLYREPLMYVLEDPNEIRDFIAQLGWWGPLVLILINIAQIIVAPVPGYGVYLAAGFLYGWFWGGVWGSIGLLSGGMLAMAVGRQWGRPLVQRIIGSETLERWERVAHTDSTLVWGVILLSPIGDAPFLLAGLSQVSFRKIFVLAFITRVPAAFAAASVGSGAVHLDWWQLAAIIIALAVPMALVSRYQEALTDWFYARTERLLQRT